MVKHQPAVFDPSQCRDERAAQQAVERNVFEHDSASVHDGAATRAPTCVTLP
jgi:hypothetical protein